MQIAKVALRQQDDLHLRLVLWRVRAVGNLRKRDSRFAWMINSGDVNQHGKMGTRHLQQHATVARLGHLDIEADSAVPLAQVQDLFRSTDLFSYIARDA